MGQVFGKAAPSFSMNRYNEYEKRKKKVFFISQNIKGHYVLAKML